MTANLAGVPAISVPAGADGRGLPVGLQLIGPGLGEENLYTLAGAVERFTGFPAREEAPWRR